MIRIFSLLTLFSVLTLVLTACPAASTTPTPTPDFSIAVSNAAPSIAEGASTTITVTITPTGGFSDQAALTINNPADVTASFNPASTNSTSSLTLSSAKAGTYPMNVTGTSGSITKTAAVTLTVTGSTAPTPPSTSTISGKVLNFGGQPVANVPVVILGQDPASQVLTTTALTGITNSSGEFTITGVTKPYDISAIATNTGKISTTYIGLTKDDPTLFVLDFGLTPTKQAIFRGDTDELPSPSNQHRHQGAFGSPEALQPFDLANNGNYRRVNTASADVSVNWFGPATTTGRIHVLQWKQQSISNPLPMSYTGYGNRDVILTDQSTTNNQNVTLTALGSNNAGGSISLPTGYTLNKKAMMVKLDTNTRLQFAQETNSNLNFNYVTPQINNANITFSASATSANGRTSSVMKQGLGLTDTNIAITIPDAPSLALPTNNAANVSYNTEFQWAPFGDTNSVNIAFVLSPVTGQLFFIISKDSKMKLPDLSAQGMPINPSFGAPGTPIPYSYQVQSLGPLSSVNDAAAPNLIKLLNGQLINSDMALGLSQTFDFTVPSQ